MHCIIARVRLKKPTPSYRFITYTSDGYKAYRFSRFCGLGERLYEYEIEAGDPFAA